MERDSKPVVAAPVGPGKDGGRAEQHQDADGVGRPGTPTSLDPHTRELYADWRTKARDTVADVRTTATRYPDDPELTGLVGELTVHSPEFASLWAVHPVQDCAVRYTREFRHPLVGAMTLNNEIMELSNDEGQRMAVSTAGPGSPSAAALRLLADLAAARTQEPHAAASAVKTEHAGA